MKLFLWFLLAVSMATPSLAQSSRPANTAANDRLSVVKWRSIGPFRGGRSNCASGVPGDMTTYYMGTTGGGLWKTADMGLSWQNISDGYFKTASVGAITVAESDVNVVYVGMGEHAVRGVMTHHGDGVYRSTDAGKTWQHMGLQATQHISRIVVHPKDANTLLVGAQGALYSPSKERGIYKSTDGGKTWKNVLYINDETGCAELSIDHSNPRNVFAAMWDYGRKPWQVKSGGPGSGLYKSTDGGETWKKLTDGLPTEMGKMSISVCRSNPEKVYALIESDSEKEAGGLFVSNDGGDSWSRVTNNHRLIQRAWYYIELFTDPTNDQIIYVLSAPALRSIDGGQNWEEIDGPHGDYHDLWINPANPKNMIIADDGGASVSVNFGKSWSPQSNMPTAQFYRINVDNLTPYNIYGGQQDNTSVKIASRESASSTITPRSWSYSAGGESAFLAFDPDNPRYVMGGSYQGTIEVLDVETKASTSVMAAPIQYLGRDAKDNKYRFNWNAPIIWSRHEPGTFYHGGQLLLRTRDMGKSWEEVSPDLTRNEKSKQGRPGVPYTNEAVGAENYGTLSYVIESPIESGVMYTGSDDGLVYITRDNGKSWQNITPAGLTECLINAIDVSHVNKGTVYIATTRYKFNDHRPGLYKSTDYGKTWKAINNGIPDNAFTRVIREDETKSTLLFAGTELGLFISYNGGQLWEPFQSNLPVTPITDLRVHRNNLIASTSGRSFWILDDLNAVRAFETASGKLNVLKPDPATLWNGWSGMQSSDPSGVHPFAGVNPANGLTIFYELPEIKDSSEVTMEIRDANGALVRKFSSVPDSLYRGYEGAPSKDPVLMTRKGLNRFVWNLRYPTVPGIADVYIESSFSGHKAIPGKYQIKLTAGGQSVTTEAEILPNAAYGVSENNYRIFDQTMKDMEGRVTEMHKRINQLHDRQQQLQAITKHLASDPQHAALHKDAQALLADLKAWDEDMIQRKSKAYDDVENFPNKFTANYMFMMNQGESDIPVITTPLLQRKQELDAEWTKLKARADALDNRLLALNKQLSGAGIGPIWAK